MRTETIFPPMEDPENPYSEQIAKIKTEIAKHRRSRRAAEVESFRTISKSASDTAPSKKGTAMQKARHKLLEHYELAGPSSPSSSSRFWREEKIEDGKIVFIQSPMPKEKEVFLVQTQMREKGTFDMVTIRECLIWSPTQTEAMRLGKEIALQNPHKKD